MKINLARAVLVSFIFSCLLQPYAEAHFWQTRKTFVEMPAILRGLPTDSSIVSEIRLPHGYQAGDPIVIHLQDAHQNVEAQTRIAQALSTLLRRYPRAVLGIEGASGAFHFEAYRKFSDRAFARDLATAMLRQSLITGPEFLGLTSAQDIRFVGIETPELYRRNVQALSNPAEFADAAKARDGALVENLLLNSPDSAVKVLVAGGFHTAGITAILSKKKIAYVVLTPRLRQVQTSSPDYAQIFSQEPTPLEKLFSPKRAALAAPSHYAEAMPGMSDDSARAVESLWAAVCLAAERPMEPARFIRSQESKRDGCLTRIVFTYKDGQSAAVEIALHDDSLYDHSGEILALSVGSQIYSLGAASFSEHVPVFRRFAALRLASFMTTLNNLVLKAKFSNYSAIIDGQESEGFLEGFFQLWLDFRGKTQLSAADSKHLASDEKEEGLRSVSQAITSNGFDLENLLVAAPVVVQTRDKLIAKIVYALQRSLIPAATLAQTLRQSWMAAVEAYAQMHSAEAQSLLRGWMNSEVYSVALQFFDDVLENMQNSQSLTYTLSQMLSAVVICHVHKNAEMELAELELWVNSQRASRAVSSRRSTLRVSYNIARFPSGVTQIIFDFWSPDVLKIDFDELQNLLKEENHPRGLAGDLLEFLSPEKHRSVEQSAQRKMMDRYNVKASWAEAKGFPGWFKLYQTMERCRQPNDPLSVREVDYPTAVYLALGPIAEHLLSDELISLRKTLRSADPQAYPLRRPWLKGKIFKADDAPNNTALAHVFALRLKEGDAFLKALVDFFEVDWMEDGYIPHFYLVAQHLQKHGLIQFKYKSDRKGMRLVAQLREKCSVFLNKNTSAQSIALLQAAARLNDLAFFKEALHKERVAKDLADDNKAFGWSRRIKKSFSNYWRSPTFPGLWREVFTAAAGLKDAEILRMIFDLNPSRLNNYHALHSAAAIGSLGAVNILLEHKAEVNLRNDDSGDSALLIAARHNRVDVVQRLLQAQADVSVLNEEDQSALSMTVQENYAEVAHLLLDHKAPADVKVDEEPLINVAADNNNRDLVARLWDLTEWHTLETQRLFNHLARHGIEDLALRILQEKPRWIVRIETQDEMTGLMWAASGGSLVLVKALWESLKERYKNHPDKLTEYLNRCETGQTALGVAVQNCHDAVVEYLLGQGSDIHQLENRTLIAESCRRGLIQIVATLMMAGAVYHSYTGWAVLEQDAQNPDENQKLTQILHAGQWNAQSKFWSLSSKADFLFDLRQPLGDFDDKDRFFYLMTQIQLGKVLGKDDQELADHRYSLQQMLKDSHTLPWVGNYGVHRFRLEGSNNATTTVSLMNKEPNFLRTWKSFSALLEDLKLIDEPGPELRNLAWHEFSAAREIALGKRPAAFIQASLRNGSLSPAFYEVLVNEISMRNQERSESKGTATVQPIVIVTTHENFDMNAFKRDLVRNGMKVEDVHRYISDKAVNLGSYTRPIYGNYRVRAQTLVGAGISCSEVRLGDAWVAYLDPSTVILSDLQSTHVLQAFYVTPAALIPILDSTEYNPFAQALVQKMQ